MYRILGIDQKIYGPVSADQLRRWLAEGRLNQATMIHAEGTADWKPLSSFAEFTVPPVIPPTITVPPVTMVRTGDGDMATVALVLGVLSNCCFGFICAVAGIICAIIALNNPQTKNKGTAIAGLVLSVIGLGSQFFLPTILNDLLSNGGFHFHRHWRHF